MSKRPWRAAVIAELFSLAEAYKVVVASQGNIPICECQSKLMHLESRSYLTPISKHAIHVIAWFEGSISAAVVSAGPL